MKGAEPGVPTRILVPVDFSDHSEAALVWAARLAGRLGAELTVLHVVHDPEPLPGYYFEGVGEAAFVSRERAAREMLEAFISRTREAHPELSPLAEARSSLVSGLPANRILEIAGESGADHIVMGSQGRTGLAHLLVGSKAERVVRLARVPVTIVKAPPAEEAE